MSGLIFDIQRFSTHDGPGIRTVLFFKGCPLLCPWCENPESQVPSPEILYNPGACIGCGSCLGDSLGGHMRRKPEGGLEVLRDRGSPPPELAELCPSLALKIAGRRLEPGEALAELLKDEAFFRESGGGVTLSGGEPLSQGAFALELARSLLERGIGVAVESCLYASPELVADFAALPVAWLADLKHVDAGAFRAATGGELAPILANLEFLAASGADLTLRVPVIPGFNADRASLRSILEYAASLPGPEGSPARARRVDFLPYHDLALGKYAQLGRTYPYRRGLAADRRELGLAAQAGASLGLEIAIGG